MPVPQIATKTCKQCGAENDLILSNCKNCNSSLPRIELDTIPEEQLLNNCSYWLAKLESLTDFDSYVSAKSAEDSSKQFGALAKLMTSGPSLSEVIGSTDKYIRALAVRAQSSLELATHIQEFRERQKAALAGIEANRKKKSRLNFILLPAALVSLPALAWAVFHFTIGAEMQKSSAEETRLNVVMGKAEQAIARGDMKAAKFFVSQIKWEAVDLNDKIPSDKAKAWDEKRAAMLKAIEP